jgi:DNA-binding transcriptional MerR regulator
MEMNISKVAKKYELTPATLRYYETEGLIPPVKRVNGIRIYDEQDCGWIEFVKKMRDAGVPVEVIAQYTQMIQEGEGRTEERKQLLTTVRQHMEKRLKDTRYTLKQIEKIIASFDDPEGPLDCDIAHLIG